MNLRPHLEETLPTPELRVQAKLAVKDEYTFDSFVKPSVELNILALYCRMFFHTQRG